MSATASPILTIENAKFRQNYQRAGQRPACSNCMHATEHLRTTPVWWCDVGDFVTTSLAICSVYRAKKGAKS
jgi:hypothetical protein